MDFIQLIESNLLVTIILAGILGLIIGSFLNVVIARYPVMLQKSWRSQCLALLEKPAEPEARFNLTTPR